MPILPTPNPILNDKIKMLRSTLSYLSFGLVSESVESEVAEVPVPEVESKVEVTSPVEDNWVILGQDLTVRLILSPYNKITLHLYADLYVCMTGGHTSN